MVEENTNGEAQPTRAGLSPRRRALCSHVVAALFAAAGWVRPAAPYFNALAGRAALFTNSHAVAHPSEPNYLALFAGDTLA